jgi:hypothetical protein
VRKDTELLLSLLEFGVFFVDYVKLALAAHDLAINASLFYACSDFHVFFVLSHPEPETRNPERVTCYLYLNVILAFVKSYGLISNFTGSPGRILM